MADLATDAASTSQGGVGASDGTGYADGSANRADGGSASTKGPSSSLDRPRAVPRADGWDAPDATDSITGADALLGSDTQVAKPKDPAPCPNTAAVAEGSASGANPAPPAKCSWDTDLNAELAAEQSVALTITLGRKAESPTGAFVALQKGDWLGMYHGMQGSFHAYVAFRVLLPGSSGGNHKLMFDAWLADGCAVVAGGTPPQIWLWPVAGAPAQWGNTENGDPGTMLYFELPSAESAKFCGKWVSLHVRVLDPITGAYGETSEQVRLFDTAP